VKNWIKHENIKYIKGKSKHESKHYLGETG